MARHPILQVIDFSFDMQLTSPELAVYYRVYTPNVGLPSKHPAFAEKSFVGRIRASSVAPPQTVFLVKQRLCMVEKVKFPSGSTLFLSKSSSFPANDVEHLPILAPGGWGSTPEDPVELVIRSSDYYDEIIMSPNPQYCAKSVVNYSMRALT
jgi:hypothetical protein